MKEKKGFIQLATAFIIFIYVFTFSAPRPVQAVDLGGLTTIVDVLRRSIPDYTILCKILEALGVIDCADNGGDNGGGGGGEQWWGCF